MAAVTAAMIKKLREVSGAGMTACKSALVESDGDFDRAVDLLRERGLAAAAKKAARIASEGLCSSYINPDNSIGVIVEINSETDFVAKTDDFRGFVSLVLEQVHLSKNQDVAGLLAEKWHIDDSQTVSDALINRTAVIGEKLDIRRFARFEKQGAGLLVNYIHGGGRVAVLAELSCDKPDSPELSDAGKNVCMQIAAMSPKFVSREDISSDFIDKEKEILSQAVNAEEAEASANADAKGQKYRAKPEQVLQRIIQGKLDKELKELCLVEQEYVKDSEFTVGQYLAHVSKEIGASVAMKRFVRFETGEGLEKRIDDFAAEVNKMMQS
ncbi:MAG: translation elongation factor Ts [Clostridiales bacterium]|jgi:elongation factor Ts|nr:translation elongation factor Ts [Clostridiales bacterium]